MEQQGELQRMPHGFQKSQQTEWRARLGWQEAQPRVFREFVKEQIQVQQQLIQNVTSPASRKEKLGAAGAGTLWNGLWG